MASPIASKPSTRDLQNPVSDAMALQGAKILHQAIIALSSGEPSDEDLLNLLVGANLSGLALCNTRVCIHHAVCHGLGALGGLPHGLANTIMLPHSLEFNRDAAASELGRIAIALEVGDEPRAAIEAVRRLQQSINCVTRLRDTNLRKELLPELPSTRCVNVASTSIRARSRIIRRSSECFWQPGSFSTTTSAPTVGFSDSNCIWQFCLSHGRRLRSGGPALSRCLRRTAESSTS